jgi:tight adherence protein C
MSAIFPVLVQLMTFLTVMLGSLAIGLGIWKATTMRRRLGEKNLSAGPNAQLLQERQATGGFLEWVRASSSISDKNDHKALARQLIAAGFEHPLAPLWFVMTRFGLAIGLPLIYLLSQSLFGATPDATSLTMWALLACAIGLLLPSAVVSRLGTIRKTNLLFEFPDALDLMVVCVEAGLGIDAAIVRVVREVKDTHPLIAREFERVSDQVRAGMVRADALRAMADRIALPAFNAFVALLVQAEALGTSVALALRTYSVELRQARLLSAEEKALRIPVVMTIPLVACILPVIVGAVLLPAIIDVVRILIPSLQGG